jgi:hypothetical protein
MGKQYEAKQKAVTPIQPVKARSYFYETSGEVHRVTCDVLEYDESLKKFIVEFPSTDDPT